MQHLVLDGTTSTCFLFLYGNVISTGKKSLNTKIIHIATVVNSIIKLTLAAQVLKTASYAARQAPEHISVTPAHAVAIPDMAVVHCA